MSSPTAQAIFPFHQILTAFGVYNITVYLEELHLLRLIKDFKYQSVTHHMVNIPHQ